MLNLDPRDFSKAFIQNSAKRELGKFLDKLGPALIDQAITKDVSFAQAFADKEAEFKSLFCKLKWATSVLTEPWLKESIPDWLKAVITKHGDKGKAWLDVQATWLMKIWRG
ncbi:MAG: hypothetical protein Q7R34_12560 [Dehalococcoidia bacterium]|nr:hypothetical protein [Dehalococcoidia bacterium]